jgi:CRISPR-associated endoribonuclease Cas6
MPPRKKLPKTNWSQDTELVSLTLSLTATANSILPDNYTIGLHAWFLHQVRNHDPQLSAYLHDGQAEKPFAISPLQGQFQTNAKNLQLIAGNTYTWSIAALCQSLCQWCDRWLSHLPPTVDICNTSFKLDRVAIALPPTTYNQLWSEPQPKQRNFSLIFLTPTSFRHKGHHLPLPIPENIFHSYLRRWNNFAPESFEPDSFLAWIDENIFVIGYNLICTKTAVGKVGFVTGFTGKVEFGLNGKTKNNPEFQRLLYTLIRLAPYCSTGHKTTFGLGQTRLEADEIDNIADAVSSPLKAHLSARIEYLTDVFRHTRKNPKSDRTTHIAPIWATILARRELGESLQAIAKDLEMPYETVKSYCKLARRALDSAENSNANS